jgi:hypothetical protein
MLGGFFLARPHPLKRLMQTPLPPISYQKRQLYRPSLREVRYHYSILNQYVFKNQLVIPPIQMGICRNYWGKCEGITDQTKKGTYCTIKLSDKWFCVQWLITTLAHEMVHQYEWDFLDTMTHRQSFFIWREELAKFNINLKISHSQYKWFQYQDLFRC